jgi:putative SOS response-associated peptidase YedK
MKQCSFGDAANQRNAAKPPCYSLRPGGATNARSETIAKSGMFRAAFAQRRCLVPAPAYYEWRDDPDGKTPLAVARVDGDPVAFGGIWEVWKSPDGEILQTFATSTTDANRQLSTIQDRMPVRGYRFPPAMVSLARQAST